jgi:Tol biopolymer transport system component
MCAVEIVWRFVVLVGVVAAGLGAMLWMREPTTATVDPQRLRYVATAEQLGVVGYRDPVGAVSLDGQRIVIAEGRRLFELPVGGGARVPIAIALGQIRHVVADGTGSWIFEDPGAGNRWWVASSRAPMRPLFNDRQEIEATPAGESTPTRRRVNELRQLAASPDGRLVAGLANSSAGAELWRVAIDGTRAEMQRVADRIAWPAWTRTGEVGCTLLTDRVWRLSLPCGQPPLALTPDREVIGPLAFSPATTDVFFATPTDDGFVELWSADHSNRRAMRRAGFDRDTYAPSVTSSGDVLFKTQTYRTSVAEIDLTSRAYRQLSTLQAETPSYHPDGRRIAVTYGTWRRVMDDAKYPDIAQEIGVIPSMPIDAPAHQPTEIIAASDSEDQAMTWSPNGKWIAFHTHREQSDDIWLRPVDRSAADRRISFLGRGAEVGWPRWSPDGRWVLYNGASPISGNSVLFVIGLNQDSGEITTPPREIAVTGIAGELVHGEWLPDSASIVAIGKEAPGRHLIATVSLVGGPATIDHRFESEHDFPGLAASPDGHHVAFVAPAPDGFFQIFRLPTAGGTPEQVTLDRGHKSQPAWSPDGSRLAYTIWSYIAQFWIHSR